MRALGESVHIPLENKLGHKDLYPLYYGHERCLPGKSFGPAVREKYLLHYIVSGAGVFYRNGVAYPVRAGEAFLIFPHEVTVYTADRENPWQYIWLGFDGELAPLLASLDSPVLSRASVDLSPLLLCEQEGGEVGLVAIACLHAMLARVLTPARRPDYVSRVENEIEARYNEEISVASLASSLGLDRRYLSRLFRDRKGIPLGQYIINVRIENAKRLLLAGIPVLRTAELVGYTDYTVFSKLFRKKVGISPRKFILEKISFSQKKA